MTSGPTVFQSRSRSNARPMQALIIKSAERGLKRTLQQQGQALILVLLLLSVAAGAVLFSFFNSTKVTLDNNQKTADALALAKTALIGRAVADANIPGSFPCPDAVTYNITFNNVPNDGVADSLVGND